MEYCDYEPLPDFMLKNKEFFKNEANLKHFTANLINIVSYLHEQRIVHRDIKPANLLISNDGQCLKLIDFGVAKRILDLDITFSPQGDFRFRCPEGVLEGGLNEKCDIWACSLVIYSVLYGQTLTTKKLTLKNYDLEKDFEGFSKDFYELMKKMLEREPDSRISAEEILKSAWLKQN